jgi:putative transposase
MPIMPHPKTVQHYHEPGHLHELTFSCYGRRPLLTNDRWQEVLARSIDAAGKEEDIQLVAFVFMPEHVHLLVYPASPKPDLGRYLARIKQPCSKQVKQQLAGQQSRLLKTLTVQERPGKTCFRFWQEGPGFDQNIFTTDVISASIDYIHKNPVARGLCRRAVEWKWSSARYYLDEPPMVQHVHLPYVHGLPEGTFA